jgi:hypothetical protein
VKCVDYGRKVEGAGGEWMVPPVSEEELLRCHAQCQYNGLMACFW